MNRFSSKGFTLIELLVVIGILGVLASALVATIDPFEQIKKANDANIKNVSVEFLNGSIRYYTTHNALPWDSVANGGAACNSTTDDPNKVNLSTWKTSCIQTLIGEGELKSGFVNFNDLNKIFVTESTNNIVVCFQPQSKSQANDANAKSNQDGTPVADPTTCKAGTPCYWCAK